jgi:hypothetical protein
MGKHAFRNPTSFALAGLLVCLLFLPPTARGESALGSQIEHVQAVTATNGMVVAQEAIAARIGADIPQL